MNPLAEKVDCIFDYPVVDTGWIIKRWFPVDLEKLRDWYRQLEADYQDWIWKYGKHKHMWKYDANLDTGNLVKDDAAWLMLTWGDDRPGPVPWMRYIAKPEYDAKMPRNTKEFNEGLGARKCLTGYGLEILENMPAPPHDVQIAIHTPGTQLPAHQDGTDKFRFHIPIFTDKDARFIINGEDIHIPADGWCYLVNTTYLHSTNNQSNVDRIHIYGNVWANDIINLNLDSEKVL
jgi:hypothetical protein